MDLQVEEVGFRPEGALFVIADLVAENIVALLVRGHIYLKVAAPREEHYMVIDLEGWLLVLIDQMAELEMQLTESIDLLPKMTADQAVGKNAVVHLPRAKSYEVERVLLAAEGVVLVLL